MWKATISKHIGYRPILAEIFPGPDTDTKTINNKNRHMQKAVLALIWPQKYVLLSPEVNHRQMMADVFPD